MITVDTSGFRAYLTGIEAFADALPDLVNETERDAADITVRTARPTVPVVTGAARGSLRVLDFRDGAAAVGGSPAVPYYPWLEYGGDAGRNHSVHRQVVPKGRYLHPAFARSSARIELMMSEKLRDAARDAGIA